MSLFVNSMEDYIVSLVMELINYLGGQYLRCLHLLHSLLFLYLSATLEEGEEDGRKNPLVCGTHVGL